MISSSKSKGILVLKVSMLLAIAIMLPSCVGTMTPTPPATQGTVTTTSPPPPPPSLQTWTNTFGPSGVALTFVGTDPSKAGAGTTTIPTVIIPVAFTFQGLRISPTDPACNDTVPITTRVQSSPIFNSTVNWTAGPTSLGTTQYVDAVQRGNFWNTVSTVSPNYHILLQPTLAAPVTLDASNFAILSGVNQACPLRFPLQIPKAAMDQEVQALIQQLHITPNQLPIFLTYNVGFLLDQGGLFLGYHFATGAQTYVVATYADLGLLDFPVEDVSILSHEIAEWMNDPLLSNQVVPWGNTADQQGCSPILEVGDPLTSKIFAVQSANFTYHMQELAFVPWFTRTFPSFSVNGWYSSQGTFQTPAPPCP